MIGADLRARRLALLDEHVASEVDQDFDRTLATFDGHPHYEIVPLGAVHDGDEECWPTTEPSEPTFPDRRHENVRHHVADDTIVAEFDLLGNDRGEFYGLPPTGHAFRVPVIAVSFFAGDRIVNERVYFDAASILVHSGHGELLSLAGQG